MRNLVFLVFLVNFFMGLVGVILIPERLWGIFELWETVLIFLPLVLSFFNVLVGWWLYQDEMGMDSLKFEINYLRDEIKHLKKKLSVQVTDT